MVGGGLGCGVAYDGGEAFCGMRVWKSQGDATRVDGLFACGLGCQDFGLFE